MTVKGATSWSGTFVCKDATGALAAASVGPVGTLYLNGTANAASVTISGANPYKWTLTLPALSAGDRVDMYITATVGGIATAAFVASDDSSIVDANLVQILGTALTETAGQIAAAFKKFFDKAAPTGTINSLPDAVAGAANGLLIAGTNAPVSIVSATGDALTLQAGGNGIGLKVTGAGSGAGIDVNGGDTGRGMGIFSAGDVALDIEGSSLTKPAVWIIANNKTGMEIDAADGAALILRGWGAGAGLDVAGGPTGSGILVAGGATSGNGIGITTTDGDGIAITTGGNSDGLKISGSGSGAGVNVDAGATGIGIDVDAAGGSGIDILGGTTYGVDAGVKISSNPTTGNTDAATALALYGGASVDGYGGDGLEITGGNASGNGNAGIGTMSRGGIASGTGWAGEGLCALPGYSVAGTGASGISVAGSGTEAGITVFQSDTGAGIEIKGGTTSGEGIRIETTDGDGINIVSVGVGKYDINADIHGTIDTVTTATNVTTALAKIKKWLQLLFRKDAAIATDNAVELAEVNADMGTGAGAFANTTDSTEAIRDNMTTPPTVTAIADQVWDEAIAGHLNPGSTGLALNTAGASADPLTNPVPGTYASGTAGAALGSITTGHITVTSPMSQDGLAVKLIRGDDYLNADGRALVWTDSGSQWPNLTGATVKFKWVTFSKTCTVIGAGGAHQQVSLDLTSAETDVLQNGYFDIEATLSNTHVVTLVIAGSLIIKDDV